jgi:putative hydrolase of the HAD superfamily
VKHFAGQPDNIAEMRRLDALANRGIIPWQEFQQAVAELSGQTPQEVWDELDDNPPNLELFAYIAEQLKPQYKIGFLSNASDDWMNDLFTQEQRALLDDVVLSFRVGLAKPDKEIFQLAASRLGVVPEECIFADDIANYCDAAREVGMEAIQYQDFEEFQQEASRILQGETVRS